MGPSAVEIDEPEREEPAEAAPRARTGRVPAVDGLRVLAVLAVFGVHACPNLVPGGYIGVDVFFVISGFVITGVLLKRPLDATGLKRFYRARLNRLMPALIAMVGLTGLAFALRRQQGELKLAPFALTYTMDFFRIVRPDHTTGAYLHTWSLAIEEQFYLVWGLVVAFVMNKRGIRWLQWTAGGLLVLSVLDSVLITVFNGALTSEVRIYNGPDTRAVQLLVGCLLATVLHSHGGAARALTAAARVLAWPAAAVLVAWAALVPNYKYNAHLWLTMPLIAVVAGCLIVSFAENATHPLTKVLGNRRLALVGARHSYSFYLWHYPILRLLGGRIRDPSHLLEAFLLSAFFAYASWQLVEARFAARRHQDLASLPSTLPPDAVPA